MKATSNSSEASHLTDPDAARKLVKEYFCHDAAISG
jgi:hypothetical protein